METIDDLLIRYLGGTATEKEREVVEGWLRNPENARSFERVLASWNEWARFRQEAQTGGDAYETANEWRRLAARMQSAPAIPFPRRKRAATAGRARRIVMAAGIAAVLAGTSFWPALREVLQPAPTFQSHTTAPGQRGSITFHDGSKVLLGPSSVLRVPDRPRRGLREVELVGTAFFEVAPNPRQPFVVTAGRTTTHVLGTKFLVRAYSDEDEVDVVVAEGRVAVRSSSMAEQDAIALADGEGVRVGRGDTAERVEEDDAANLLAWTEGRLIFRDARVEEVLRELELWYDVDIRIADPSLAQNELSLFLEERSLGQALPLIATALNAHYEWNDRVVTLYSGAKPGER